jgi:peroxiredoxin
MKEIPVGNVCPLTGERTLREGPDSLGTGLPFCPALFFLLALALVLTAPGCGSGSTPEGQTPAAQGSAAAPGAAPGSASETPRVTSLQAGGLFPAVTLLTLEGEPVSTTELIGEGSAVVMFVSLGCETCEALMGVWNRDRARIPPDFSVFAITEEEPAFAKAFAEKNQFPFPLYCDDRGIFATEYKVAIFPSSVGVSGGKVAFIGKPVTPDFTPDKAVGAITAVRQAREAADG